MPDKFRPTTIDIEAIRFETEVDADKIYHWVVDNGGSAVVTAAPLHILIGSTTGELRAEPGDVVVRRDGQFIPIAAHVFDAAYRHIPHVDPALVLRWTAAEVRKDATEPEDLGLAELFEAGADAVAAGSDPELDRAVVTKLAELAGWFADEYAEAAAQ